MNDKINKITRTAKITRNTKETEINISICLDGAMNALGAMGSIVSDSPASGNISTGSGFLNHMLTLFAFHSGFALTVDARGDTDVDYHHITEDIGITLGQCIKEALGGGVGITRYASVFLPMDEALVLVALDISGRAFLNYDVAINSPKIGDFDTELAQEFLTGLCRSLGLTLHVKLFYGMNAHHIIEALFKGLGRALGEATKPDPTKHGTIPSTKGTL